jgi:DNA-directed RNA polymerase subunit H (RpoH/RPB5)
LGYVDKINMDNEKPELTSEFSEEGYSQRHLGNVQMVNINAMCINILKHELVPLHEIIRNENEIQEILSKNNAEVKSQFPVILKHDAVAEILGLVTGDLVRIYRPSITAGEAIFYRICK